MFLGHKNQSQTNVGSKNIKPRDVSPTSTNGSSARSSRSSISINENSIEVVREIYKLGLRYKIPMDTVHLAIAWLEVFESVSVLDFSEVFKSSPPLEKIAIVLTVLSCKANQYSQLSMAEFSYKYGKQMAAYLIEVEEKVLNQTNFQFPEENSYRLFYQYFSADSKKLKECLTLFQKNILSPKFHPFGWEMLAKSIIHALTPQKWENQEPQVRVQIKTLSREMK